MALLEYLAIVVALLAAPCVAISAVVLRIDAFSVVPRLCLWVAALFVLAVAASNFDDWVGLIGLDQPKLGEIALAIPVAAFMLALIGATQLILRRLGKESAEQLRQLQEVLDRPLGNRVFLVVTAAVVEEVLYRGYAIGVGQHLLGGVWQAATVSVVVFTAAHLRWGVAHLLPVFVSALVLTQVFLFTQNLWVCIVAHAIVNGVGFLLTPAIMAQRRRKSSAG